MTVVFISNYYNHHQSPISEALDTITGHKYTFIATTTMRAERRLLGYEELPAPSFVKYSYLNQESALACQQLIDDADVVIAGSAPEHYLRNRIRKGKLIFRYSERPFKQGNAPIKYLPRLIRWHMQNPPRKPIYFLSAGAFAAYDYARFGLFRNKSYQWGYFPEAITYQNRPAKDKNSLLWVGRFLNWKHPDATIWVAKQLKDAGYSFHLNLIGRGEMEGEIRQMIGDNGLWDCVNLLGAMSPQQVRKYMEQSGILLFTSDRQEGWGAVLNEAMNSGCAIAASDSAGAVPYLIQHEKNGLIYHFGNQQQLYVCVKRMLDNPELQNSLGTAAYRTIINEWNGSIAAGRLINLAEHILSGEKSPDLYKSGPCSKSKIIKDDWYYARE